MIAQELIGELLGSRDWGLIWKEDMAQRGSSTQASWVGPEQGCGREEALTAGDPPGASGSRGHCPEECYGLNVCVPLKGMLKS